MWISVAGIYHKEGFSVRILQISRISRKRDQVANLDQIVVSNSCQLSHFGLRNNSV